MKGLNIRQTEYEAVIGLEVHAGLAVNTKMYCGCKTEFGAEPNTQCCPVCTGMPGALPVLNRKAVEYAIKAGLATNCSIIRYSRQDRKHYFYPDLPKGYQASQHNLPLCTGGFLEIEVNMSAKKVGIRGIHIEEDAGKLIHDESGKYSLVDYNRSGVPLIEIVTAPDLGSSEEVRAFILKLKTILEYTGVCDCKMQEGSLRVDINLSVRRRGESTFGNRTEIKNLNSVRAIVRAVEYEAKRQAEELEKGRSVRQETRRWDDARGVSYPMREKKGADDYRFFPDPDLCPIVIDDAWLNEIKSSLPELPDEKKKRFVLEYKLPAYDADFITGSKQLSDYFEEAAKRCRNHRAVCNWLMGDISKKLNESNIEVSDIPVSPENLAKLVELTDSGIISWKIAKQVFVVMWDTNRDPAEIIEEKGLRVINDTEEIRKVIIQVLEENPKAVEDIRNGKEKTIGFLIGQVMRKTGGKASPGIVNRLIFEELERLFHE